jgi:hypothetical protein
LGNLRVLFFKNFIFYVKLLSVQKFIYLNIIFVLLLCFDHALAQKKNVVGVLQDSISKPIVGVYVILTDKTDTLRTVSNENGFFYFTNVKNDKFNIQVKHLGFKDFNGSFNLNKDKQASIQIILHNDNIQLNEVIIKGKFQPVVLKKDTVEYNAAAYNIYENDKVENLLRQLPGIEVDKDGNVTTEGKPVNKLRVNGIDFFTGNVRELIRQLPANIMDKVQIIENYGDEAAFTGIKKGEPAKLLNLVTKPGMNHGKFGDINATAGTNERYGAAFNENFWKDVKQIAIAADLNTEKNIVGINNANRVSLTYNNNLTKYLNVNNNYSFSNTKESSQNTSFAETINSAGTINNNTDNTSWSKSNTHNFNSNVTYKPNEAEYIKSTINLSFNNSNNTLSSISQQYGVIREDLKSYSTSSVSNPQVRGTVSFGHRLNKKGRVITASIQYYNKSSNNDQPNDNAIRYYDSLGNPVKDSILNRLITNTNHAQTSNINFSYSEPLSTNSTFDFTYNLNLDQQKTILITELSQPYGLIRIDSLSQSFNSTLWSHNLGLNFRYNHNKIGLLLGMNLQRNTLDENFESQNLSIANSITNFSPILNLNYTGSKNNQYELNYSGSSAAPTFDQLQSVRDTRDLQNVIVGNPNLKPSFSHTLNFTYRHVGLKSGQVLLIRGSGSLIENQIINNTSLEKDTLGSLKQITSYLNVNGAYSFNLNYNWSFPFKIIKQPFRISFIGSTNYNYGIVYTDSIKSHNVTKIYSQSIRASSYLKKISFDAGIIYQKNINQYTTGHGLISSIQNWNFTLNTNITICKNLNFNIESTKRLNQGYQNIDVNNPLVINATLKLILSESTPIHIQVQALDLFNQSNQIGQIVTNNTIINSHSKYVSRYLIFSLNMPISKFGKSFK